MQSQDSQHKRGISLGQAAGAGVLVFVGALLASLEIDDAGWRGGLSCGVVTSGLGAIVSAALVRPALGRPMNSLVGAMGMGFFARMVLVAVGLLVTTRRLHAEPIAFALSFFLLFFVFAALELMVVVRHAQPPAASSQES